MLKEKYKKGIISLNACENDCFLLTNGLGGYCSLTPAGTPARNDHAFFMSALKAPNERYNIVSCLREELVVGDEVTLFSSHHFTDLSLTNDNTQYIESFTTIDEADGLPALPTWVFNINGIRFQKQICMRNGYNTISVEYSLTGGLPEALPSDAPVYVRVTPFFKLTPKNSYFDGFKDTSSVFCAFSSGGTLYDLSDNPFSETPDLYFPMDTPDGRADHDKCFTSYSVTVPLPRQNTAGTRSSAFVSFSTTPFSEDNFSFYEKIVHSYRSRREALLANAPFSSELGKALLLAGDSYLVRRDSVNGKTIIAGYPFFEDWGRDTFISLPGLTLSSNRIEDCKLILETFARYEKDGLFPNLFPEGGFEPMYNSVDAPLLFISTVCRLYKRFDEKAFAQKMLPCMRHIITSYEKGTHYGIQEDTDGLIRGGEGLFQLTWMDVRVGDYLPTPRHGKPVEINALWYNALCFLYELTGEEIYKNKAALTGSSFNRLFIKPEGYLKDVINGTYEEDQLRPNQLYALVGSYPLLPFETEMSVLDTITSKLYTTAGIRTLSPEDPAFRPFYTGPMEQRDRAYHQGTVWVYPLGIYYSAIISRLNKMPPEAQHKYRTLLKEGFSALYEHLYNEGCLGQLPEIYDGLTPSSSKGCFAQAWSVATLLEAVELYEALPI